MIFKGKGIKAFRQAHERIKTLDIAGARESAEQMAKLSEALVSVGWRKHSIIVSHSKTIHNEMNVIRAKIEKIPSDIITLIPSARWLIDNFQLIYREIKKLNFSTTGYARIPVLKSSQWKGLPRIYVIASKMVELSGGYLNEENIITMVKAYQGGDPLTDRELQILPEMLGLCLLEHILDVTRSIKHVVDVKAQADQFVKEAFEGSQDYPDISMLLTEESEHRESIYFHSHVLYLLKNLSVEQEAILRYISFHFKDEWENIGLMDIFKEESRQESILESTIRNPIASLRELNELNEDEMFEELSAIERILSQDPDKVYPQMDSLSRAMYRDKVERLSVRYHIQETDISKTCLKLAQRGDNRLNHSHHVGTYLIGKGAGLMRESLLDKKSSGQIKEPTPFRGVSYFVYVGCMVCLLLLSLFLIIGQNEQHGQIVRIIFFMLAAFPVVAGISTKMANSFFTRGIPAKNLPAMDYTKGIPGCAKTMVVMPVIISSKEQGLEYINRLQKHFLANRQGNLFFALLADYADAPEKMMPEDEEIRDALISRIRELNGESAPHTDKFSLFIRERRWNPSEGRYMCWERKRGKLEEFNRLINNGKIESTSFEVVKINPELLSGIQYVITLDADSDLVLDNASKLVGIIDHPLNRAIIDPMKKTVKEGYAIIQPHVMNHIIDTGNSFFQKVYSGKTGLPNYSMAVSDVYQDVFKSAIFIGKGIYNARVFHQLLNQVIPENRVLSHDLLESCYIRTAFAGNAHIVETFPGSFASYAKRQNRWIRGDWQLLPWLLKKEISFLSKWKILDDLRSSLVPVGKLLFILMNILFFPDMYWLWIGLFAVPLALDLFAILVDIVMHLIQGRRYVLLYRKLLREIGLLFTQFGFDLVFIPFEAYNSLDAIIRTLYRYLVSKKNFLKWDSAEHVERSAENSLKRYFSQMWHSFIASAAVWGAVAVSRLPWPGVFLYSVLAVAWGLSFLIAYVISQAAWRSRDQATPEMAADLRETARRIWRFFKDFSLPANNFLCPDNYQIGRREKVVNKTSPTNIGLQLLSALSAWDLGFEMPGSTLKYVDSVLQSVKALPKWQGHLFNWYTTLDLKTLNPHYISTVDSGNFFGYLITLKYGLEEMRKAPFLSSAILNELNHLLAATGAVDKIDADHVTNGDFIEQLVHVRQSLVEQQKVASSRDAQDFIRLAETIQQELEKFDLGSRAFTDRVSLYDLSLEGNLAARDEMDRIAWMTDTIEGMVNEAKFGSLYNRRRKLFYIGFNVSSQTYDQSCYDLIASESLLTSLLAIAKGDVPVNHWQRLGRPLALIKGRPAHVSWSGTMFEYLMPYLVVKEFAGSVFDDSSSAAVLQQMRHARKFSIPWGMSESQYNRFDIDQNYQYKAFGVPKIRLQPVYKEMQVVSPYSTMLALEYNGKMGFRNLKALQELGAYGEYGFYEAVDFTVPDPVTLKNFCIVKSFMSHHQGMSLLAIDNFINSGIMRARFHASPMITAAQTLLEETHQSLFASPSRRGYTVNFKRRDLPEDVSTSIRYVKSVNLPIPSINHMSNGNYSVLVTSDGDGFSQWKDTMLYRWRPDLYADTGFYIYIRDIALNTYWSAAHNPSKVKADKYQVVFSPHQSEFLRQDKGITTSTIISLMPDYNLEIRKVKLKNLSLRERQLEVTSYMEVAIDTLASESSHPAYNKLFVENEFLEERNLFISRRRRGIGSGPYAMHMLQTNAKLIRKMEYESSRVNFVGRNNSLQNPQAVREGKPLSCSTDYSGDSIMSLRACVSLSAGETAEIMFVSGLFESREAILNASDEFSMTYRIEDAVERFRQQSRIELKYLDMTGNQQRALQNIIRQIYYPYRYLRGPDESIRRNWSGQNGLWKFSISGDNPIMLLHVKSADEISLVRDVLKIYEYMGINMIKADLVVLAEGTYGYTSELSNMLSAMLSSLRVYESAREKTGIHIIHSYELSPSEMDLIYTVANVVFSDDSGIYFRKTQSSARIQ